MPTSLSRKVGVIASILLALVLLGALVGCGAPLSADHANSTGEATSTAAVQASAAHSAPATPHHGKTLEKQPEGHVSAQLPPHDPEVLVDKRTAEKASAHGKRILTLDRAGALSRMVWALGMGENLIGRDIASDFPGVSHLPQVTPGGHSINAETVMALRPDLILTDGTIGPSRVVQKLRDAGVSVVSVTEDRTPEKIGQLIDDVTAAVGLEKEAARIKKHVDAQLAEATEKAQAKADGRKMMMLYVRGTGVAMIAGPESGGRSLINRLGGVDAGEKLGITGAFTPLTPEALIAAAPDTFIVMSGGLESVGGIDGLLEIPGVSQTPAGRNRSVLDVPDSQLLSFGSETPRVIDAMAEALYG